MTMKTGLKAVSLMLTLAFAGTELAAHDVKDGNAYVSPVKSDRYEIDGNIMGKAELYGVIADLRDTDHLTGVVLRNGGNDDQAKVIQSICKTLGLKAFREDIGGLKPLD